LNGIEERVLEEREVLFTLIMKAILFSETSVLARATRHHFAEDGIFQSVFISEYINCNFHFEI
jgi:hypothetical protein